MEMVLKVHHDKESNKAPAAPGRRAKGGIAFNQVGLQNCAKLIRQPPTVLSSNRASHDPVVKLFRLPGTLVACRVSSGGPSCLSIPLLIWRTDLKDLATSTTPKRDLSTFLTRPSIQQSSARLKF
jgi:hypothetical protein